MRSKAPLVLMEQLVMVLVFALAAALCVQAFVLSDRTSRACELRDQAVAAAQSTAETLKHCHGDYARAAELLGGTWNGYLLGTRVSGGDGGDCDVLVTPVETEQALLGEAQISVYDPAGTLLYSLPAAWQLPEDGPEREEGGYGA